MVFTRAMSVARGLRLLRRRRALVTIHRALQMKPLNDVDPITQDKLPEKSFTLVAPDGTVFAFDPKPLWNFFCETQNTINPITRGVLNETELKRLAKMNDATVADLTRGQAVRSMGDVVEDAFAGIFLGDVGEIVNELIDLCAIGVDDDFFETTLATKIVTFQRLYLAMCCRLDPNEVQNHVLPLLPRISLLIQRDTPAFDHARLTMVFMIMSHAQRCVHRRCVQDVSRGSQRSRRTYVPAARREDFRRSRRAGF